MKIFVMSIMLLPFISFSQEEQKRGLMGFGIEGDFNLLDEPTLSFEEYRSVVGAPEFFVHGAEAELISSGKIFSRNGLRARMIFKGPDNQNLGAFKRSRVVLGVTFNTGNNYTFKFSESNRVRSDTLILTNSAGFSETLYKDTIYYRDTRYTATSSNLGAFCEYLIYTGEGMPTLSTGIGVAADLTLMYEAQVDQNLNFSTGLFDEQGISKYTPVNYNPSNDNYTYGDVTWINGSQNTQRIKTAYFVRPYIPVRLETPLSNIPGLSNFTVDINGKIGTEIQFNPGASINARMFYSLGLGLNYYM